MSNSFAVVTGAANGMGLEISRLLGLSGFELLIVSETDEIFEVERQLKADGYMTNALKLNLATFAEVERLVQKIESFGKVIDVIVINTGTGPGGPFLEAKLREDIHCINSNIVSTIHIMKRCLPMMSLAGSGRILLTASSAFSSLHQAPNSPVFTASKSFLLSFAESLRTELNDTGITITTLLPGDLYSIESTVMARQGFDAMMKGREHVFVDKFLTKLQEVASKILSGKALTKMNRKWPEPNHDHH